MKRYFHFKIKGSRNKGSVLLTQAGLGVYKTLINNANYDLQLNKKPLLCATMLADINILAKINEGQVIINPDNLPKNLQYFEFPSVDDLQLIWPYERAIELQMQIDKLPFQAPRKRLTKLAQEIQEAEEMQDIPGNTFDALMYQLWERDEELIGNILGYQYEHVEHHPPEEPEDPDDGEIPLF